MIRLILLGPPGSGKGTQSAILSKRLNIPHICIGDMLRQTINTRTSLELVAKQYISQGEFIPDELAYELNRERLEQNDAQTGWVLDGFPGNLSQVHMLAWLLLQKQQRIDCVISLKVPTPVLFKRLLARGRQDDNKLIITRRLREHQKQVQPVLDFYQEQGSLRDINGDASVATVSQRLHRSILSCVSHNKSIFNSLQMAFGQSPI